MKDLRTICIATVIILCILGVKADNKQAVAQPSYTQDLTQFNDKKHLNSRLQKLLACWLYIRDNSSKEGQKQLEEYQWLSIMKTCMKRISRKDAVLKITELGKRNYQPVTAFETIVDIPKQLVELGDNAKKSEKSQFDLFLLQKSNDFKKQLTQIHEKGDINSQIEEQLKKRQKYYFGFIPASVVNHTTILITLTMIMMCCCTWFRLYRAVDKPKDQNKKRAGSVAEEEQIEGSKKKIKSSIMRMGSKGNKNK